MGHLPHVNRWTPPSDDELAARRAEADRLRAGHDAARAAEAPARRAALEAGPPLRDVDAAVACHCSCHPRPATTTLHDGGVTCPCQQTPAQRRASMDAALASFAALAPAPAEAEAHDARNAAAAARLGVTVRQMGGAAPFVISGVVDGRAFFLRERHDAWRVEIAADDTPLEDPWTAAPETPTITVASGTVDALETDGRFDEVRALEVAADAVRLFLARRTCAHTGAGRFCPTCGVDVADADAWRISTAR